MKKQKSPQLDILIIGDSFAARGAGLDDARYEQQTWMGMLRQRHSVINRACGGSDIDHTDHQLYNCLTVDRLVPQVICVALTSPNRHWHSGIVEHPELSGQYSEEPGVRELIRHYAQVPDWDIRRVYSAIRSYHSISVTGPRVVMLAPFLQGYDIGVARDRGLLPKDSNSFWLMPVNLQAVMVDWDSNNQSNHMPTWCHFDIYHHIQRWLISGTTRLYPELQRYAYPWYHEKTLS